MNLPQTLARHLREVYFGGNWTAVNLKDSLTGVDWQQATARVHSFNTIAALVFHINYYVHAVFNVLKGGQLDASDRFSFDVPVVSSQEEWDRMLDQTWLDAGQLALLVEQLPETKLLEVFAEEKYGTYYRNIQGLIEHTHYHLGQIVLIKKWLLQEHAAQGEE